MNKWKPCPFCGCTTVKIREYFTAFHGPMRYGECNGCHVRTPLVQYNPGFPEEAEQAIISFWNTRHT